MKFQTFSYLTFINFVASYMITTPKLQPRKLNGFRLQSTDESEDTPKDVDSVISKLMDMLSSKSGVDLSAPGTEDDIETLNSQFQKLLKDVKTTSLTEVEKSLFYTEATLTFNSMKDKKGPSVANLPRFDSSFPTTKLFSETAAPYVCCYSTGKVGLKLKDEFKKLGSSIPCKFLDSNTILGLPENELKFIMKDARTILLACDNDLLGDGVSKKGGWFDKEPSFSSLDSTSLKKILNMAMNERNKNPNPYPIKVVALTKGMREGKSIASLLSGDTYDLESDCILLCNQRNLDYAIVKVGTLIDDSTILKEDGHTVKRLKEEIMDKSTSSKYPSNDADVIQKIFQRPILLSTSRVDISEYTKISVAADTMLRMASYPVLNTSFAILSTAPSTSTTDSVTIADPPSPTQEDWNDEFGKLIGPELVRIPLKYTSTIQTIIRLTRAINRLTEPNSGLITPINIEKYSNGFRIIFKPKDSTYTSSKEDREYEILNTEETPNNKKSSDNIPKNTGYMSPEQEAKLLKSQTERIKEEEATKKKMQLKMKLDGGLEVFIDDLPYKRLRIRRCNMGSKTIVKEESEALIIKTILNTVQILENDYRILLATNTTKI